MRRNFYKNSFDTKLFDLVLMRREKWIWLFNLSEIGFSEALNLGIGVFFKGGFSLAPVFARNNGLSFRITSKQVRQSFTF